MQSYYTTEQLTRKTASHQNFNDFIEKLIGTNFKNLMATIPVFLCI